MKLSDGHWPRPVCDESKRFACAPNESEELKARVQVRSGVKRPDFLVARIFGVLLVSFEWRRGGAVVAGNRDFPGTPEAGQRASRRISAGKLQRGSGCSGIQYI